MSKHYLTIGSVTKANMAVDILRGAGIMGKIIKTPLGQSKQGCGYSIVVSSDPERAAGIIERGGVRVTGISIY